MHQTSYASCLCCLSDLSFDHSIKWHSPDIPRWFNGFAAVHALVTELNASKMRFLQTPAFWWMVRRTNLFALSLANTFIKSKINIRSHIEREYLICPSILDQGCKIQKLNLDFFKSSFGTMLVYSKCNFVKILPRHLLMKEGVWKVVDLLNQVPAI